MSEADDDLEYEMDNDELEWEVTCLEAETHICWQAFDAILAAETLEDAKRIVAVARQAISDGCDELPALEAQSARKE